MSEKTIDKIKFYSLSTIMDIKGWSLLGTKILTKLYMDAALSPNAKEHWQEGMVSIEEIEKWMEESQQGLIHSRVSKEQIGYSNALVDLSKWINTKKP